jgi:hypothetical protein
MARSNTVTIENGKVSRVHKLRYSGNSVTRTEESYTVTLRNKLWLTMTLSVSWMTTFLAICNVSLITRCVNQRFSWIYYERLPTILIPYATHNTHYIETSTISEVDSHCSVFVSILGQSWSTTGLACKILKKTSHPTAAIFYDTSRHTVRGACDKKRTPQVLRTKGATNLAKPYWRRIRWWRSTRSPTTRSWPLVSLSGHWV